MTQACVLRKTYRGGKLLHCCKAALRLAFTNAIPNAFKNAIQDWLRRSAVYKHVYKCDSIRDFKLNPRSFSFDHVRDVTQRRAALRLSLANSGSNKTEV